MPKTAPIPVGNRVAQQVELKKMRGFYWIHKFIVEQNLNKINFKRIF
jgi:hypothetical protein